MTIKKFIYSFLKAVGNMDISTLEPMSNFMFHPLFAKEWVDKIEQVIEFVEKENLSFEDIAKLISGPSHLRAQFFFLLCDLKCAKTEKEKRIKIANFWNVVLKKKAVEDEYGEESNIVHTKDDIKNLIWDVRFNQGNEEIGKEIGRLYSAGYHLVNGLYTDFYTDFGVECFGQYILDNDHILVIRQFNDLNPKELWPEIDSPCERLTIHTIYKNIKFRCDAISVHSIFEGDTIKNLVRWAIEIDGRFIDSIGQINNLREKLENESIKQWKRLISLEFEKLKEKGLFIRGYVFKDLFEKLRLDWKPSKEMLNVVKGKKFVDDDYWGAPKYNDKEKEYWNRLLDPEIDFYPNGA